MPPTDDIKVRIPGTPRSGAAITADAADITGTTTGAVEAAGHFRIYLGVAAGAGKTIAMLDQGNRRRAYGADVVIAYVETHGRRVTESRIRSLEIVPRRVIDYKRAR